MKIIFICFWISAHDILELSRRFCLGKCSKKFFFDSSQVVQKYIKMIFRTSRTSRKWFWMIFGRFGIGIDFLKKKCKKKCPQMSKFSRFLKFQNLICGRKWPIIGRKASQKFRSVPKSYQNFFYPPTPKIREKISKKLPPKKSTFRG